MKNIASILTLMRLKLTTTDLEGRGTTSATEMSKMIPNLPTFH